MKRKTILNLCKRGLSVILTFAMVVAAVPAVAAKAAGGTENIVLKVGEVYSVNSDSAVEITSSPETNIATAVSKGITMTKLYSHTNSSEFVNAFPNGGVDTDLSEAEFTFTASGDYWRIYNKKINKYLTNVYANRYFADVANAEDMKVIPVTQDDGTKVFRICRTSDTRYIMFHYENMRFDGDNSSYIENATDRCQELVLLEKQDTVSSEDFIPRYKRATELTAGKKYLICYIPAQQTVENIAILYPANGQSAQTKLIKVSETTDNGQLTITGVAAGDTTVETNDTTYNVSVIEEFGDIKILARNAKANSEQVPSSYATDGGAAMAFNGQTGNWWHSRYSGSPQEHEVNASGNRISQGRPDTTPIYIQTGFEKVWDVREVHYKPRTSGCNGKGYNVYVANMENPFDTPTAESWTKVATGTFANTNAEKTIILEQNYQATHVRLEFTSTQSTNDYITAEKISFYGNEAVVEEKLAVIRTSLEKLKYNTEDTSLDGLLVEKVYNTGRRARLSSNQYTISGLELTTAGTKTVTVTYIENGKSYTDTFEIEVFEAWTAEDESRDIEKNITYRCSNYETGNGIQLVYDNDASTNWHSKYSFSVSDPAWYPNTSQYSDSELRDITAANLWLEMDFTSATIVNAVRYLPKQGATAEGGSANGYITEYRILGTRADDPSAAAVSEWFVLTEGKWVDENGHRSDGWKIAEFPAVELTGVRLAATKTYGDTAMDHFANAAELRARSGVTEATLTPNKTTQASLSLNGKIDMNFYVALTDLFAKSAAKVTLTRGSTAPVNILANAATRRSVTVGSDTYDASVFSLKVAAKEMNDNINATLSYAGKDEMLTENASVRKYADEVFKKVTDETTYTVQLKDLLLAMLDYGAASQNQFGYNTGNLANANVDDWRYVDAVVDTFTGHPYQAPANLEGLTYYGSSLLLESETTLRHYFVLEGGADAAENYEAALTDGSQNSVVKTTITVDDKTLLRVDIKNIVAKDLDKDFALTITKDPETDNATTTTINYGALTYAQKVIDKTGEGNNTTLQNLAKALWNYSDKADKYFVNE